MVQLVRVFHRSSSNSNATSSSSYRKVSLNKVLPYVELVDATEDEKDDDQPRDQTNDDASSVSLVGDNSYDLPDSATNGVMTQSPNEVATPNDIKDDLKEEPKEVATSEEPNEVATPEEPKEVATSEEPNEVATPGDPKEVATSEEPNEVATPDDIKEVAVQEDDEPAAALPTTPHAIAELIRQKSGQITRLSLESTKWNTVRKVAAALNVPAKQKNATISALLELTASKSSETVI